MTEEKQPGLSRRTVVKGAAWSVPVIAAAVAVPAYAASAGFNATVTPYCTNDYDLSVLEAIGLGGLVTGLVQTALKTLLDLDPGAARGFTVTATTGTIPAGTQYTLTDPNALLTLSGLQAVVDANALGVVSTSGGFTLTTKTNITQGGTFNVNVYNALADVGAASSFTLTQVQSDDNTTDNSGTTSSLLAAAVDLSTLGVGGASGTLAIQTCAL